MWILIPSYLRQFLWNRLLKGKRIVIRSWLYRFLFLIRTRTTWGYSFSSVLLSGFQAITMSNTENNTDGFSWKRRQESEIEKISLASLLPIFVLIFSFQRWFEEWTYSFVWPYRIMMKRQNFKTTTKSRCGYRVPLFCKRNC